MSSGSGFLFFLLNYSRKTILKNTITSRHKAKQKTCCRGNGYIFIHEIFLMYPDCQKEFGFPGVGISILIFSYKWENRNHLKRFIISA